jgi:hypothetical protein
MDRYVGRVQHGKYEDEMRRSFSESRGRESTVLQIGIIAGTSRMRT